MALIDWRVADGTVTGAQSVATFQGILSNASAIDTGFVPIGLIGLFLSLTPFSRFIVLQHDLFEVTVNLAIGYTLPLALRNNPPLTVSFIDQVPCFGIDLMSG